MYKNIKVTRTGGQNDSTYHFESESSCTCGEHTTSIKIGRFVTNTGANASDYDLIKQFSKAPELVNQLKECLDLIERLKADVSINFFDEIDDVEKRSEQLLTDIENIKL